MRHRDGRDENGDYTQDWYAEVIEEGMEDAIDRVATLTEWSRCKAAALAWIAKNDAEYDRLARDQEEGIDR